MTEWELASLREVLETKLSLDELRNAAVDLGVGYEGLEKGELARQLVVNLDRRQRLGDLIEWLGKHRSDITQVPNPTTVTNIFGPRVRLVRLADVSPSSEDTIRAYYEGAPLTWNIIAAGADIERDQHDELMDVVLRAGPHTSMLCMTGQPGAGKSTLAWRIAADVTSVTRALLLHLRDSEVDDFWYSIEAALEHYGKPVIVLVDDVFRSDDVCRALHSLSPDIALTIIATSRTNEVPDHLRLPFAAKMVELGAPTPAEKERAFQRLKHAADEMSYEQHKRLQNAPSWLVMMMEATTGEELTKIVRHSVRRLQQQDIVIYRAYEYLCYAGQYDLAVPESLINRLDDRGEFHNLTERQSAKGLVFPDTRLDGFIRTSHPTIAREALKVYGRNPQVVVAEFIRASRPRYREDRWFVSHLLRRLVVDQSDTLQTVLEEQHETLKLMLEFSSSAELISDWARLYRGLHQPQKVFDVEGMALIRAPETYLDCEAQIRLATSRGGVDQIRKVIDSTAQWLAHNFEDTKVRGKYLRLIEQYGAELQVTALVNAVADWLTANSKRFLPSYLSVIRRRGKPEEIDRVIGVVADWLMDNQQDIDIYAAYLALVKKRGNREQIATAIHIAETWIITDPSAVEMRVHCLRLVEQSGTAVQLTALVDDISDWLAIYPDDTEVRRHYLDTVRRRGTSSQIETAINGTANWLIDKTYNGEVCKAYLRLVRRHGTPTQITDMIAVMSQWMAANPQDVDVRKQYLELMEHRKDASYGIALTGHPSHWLSVRPQRYFSLYCRLLREYATAQQLKEIIDGTGNWLVDNVDDVEVRIQYLNLVDRYGTIEDLIFASKLMKSWFGSQAQKDVPQLLSGYGRVLVRLGKYQEAEGQLRRALQRAKGDVLARMGLAWCLYEQGKIRAALNELNHARWWAEKKGTHPVDEVLHHLGRYYLLEGHHVQAASCFQAAINSAPQDYSNYWGLGQALLAQRDYDQALRTLIMAQEKLPPSITDRQRLQLTQLIAFAQRQIAYVQGP